MKHVRRLLYSAELIVFLVWQIILANWQIMKLLFISNQNIKPSIIGIDVRELSEREIFVLSTMITLTPGTLSLHTTQKRDLLFVHSAHADEVETIRRSIENDFKSRVRRVFGVQT
jgi:multicomponent Na+:H+ antiporter subunit E